MKTALMIAEKPSLAASLANILSGSHSSQRKGMNNACSVHEWTGTFKGESTMFKMTSVCGHVMTLDFTGKYNSWDQVDPAELFLCPTEKKEANPKLRIPAFLEQEARSCDYLILWLDCDKEGENICFEVMNAVSRSLRGDVQSDRVTYRAKFSAITEKDIQAAMKNLVRPNENEARSVDARQELDLRIGCAFTRFQTKFFQGRYGNLDSSLISYGPCQTPTLGFCVQRHDDIQNFKPESFWYLQAVLASSEIILDWMRGRCFEKDVAVMFHQNIKDKKYGLVLSVTTSEQVRSRPLALNTVELMRAASSGLGLSPHSAMQIAERLYTQGYISYPRTETTQYPNNFNLREVLDTLKPSSEWGDYALEVIKSSYSSRKGQDVGDHPPITPMKLASRHELDGDVWRVYDYIVRHFLGTLSKDLRYQSTTAKISIGSEVFTTTSNILIDPGFTTVMPWLAFGKNELTLPFQQGDQLPIKEIKMSEGQTGPPDYLTESELITLMEKHGIGTDASIPVHINNISQRNYVSIATGRKLIPTTLGIVLVHGYQKIDPELVLPTMRSALEQQLNLIAHGSADFKQVLSHAVEIFRLKFLYFVQTIDSMDQLFEGSFTSLAESGKGFSRCGKCRRYLKYIQTRPARMHCAQCDDTYSLPPGGLLRSYKELRCPLDDFELLSWSTGSKGRSYPLCPYCYNHPPFRDMKKGSGCNACTHPTCQHSLISQGVSNCTECDTGVLVLDPSAAPKWKLGCNICSVIINVFDDAQKVIVENEECDDCGSRLVKVTYRADNSKLPKNATEMTGCIFCVFPDLVEMHHAEASRTTVMRGRGRGRGRGSRGKPRVPKDKMAQLDAYFV